MAAANNSSAPTLPLDEKVPSGSRTPQRSRPGNSTPNMNGPLYMQTSGTNMVLVRRVKRKEEGTWKHLARWFVENQIGKAIIRISLATTRS